MSEYETGFADGLNDVEPRKDDSEYLRGYRRGARALDEHDRGVGPGWDE